MATAVNFFEEDAPHGLGKRLIYKKYLQAYIPTILSEKSSYKHVCIIDGFAGTGRYEVYGCPTEIEKYGTPIIALHVAIRYFWRGHVRFLPNLLPVPAKYKENLKCLKKAKEMKVELKEGIIRLVFVEPKKSNYEKLYENTIRIMLAYDLEITVTECFEYGICSIACRIPGKKDYPIMCMIVCAEFAEIETPSRPTFTLIDPFGFSQTPLEKVKEFVGQGREVFITLMSSYINRFRNVHQNSVANFFGLPVEEAMNFLSINTAKDRIATIVDRYEHQLKTRASAKYVINFEMRQISNARLYHIVFATNHLTGLEEMKEAMNRATQDPTARVLSDYLIMKRGQRLRFTNDQNNNDVADFIFSKFKGKQISISEVKRFILVETIFVYRKKPLSLLERAGKMEVTNRGTKDRRLRFPDRREWQLKFAAS